MAVARKRQTITEDNRRFENRCEEEYFVVQDRKNRICLLCDLVISVMKKNNISAHYSIKYRYMDDRYPHGTETRSSKLMCMKNVRRKQLLYLGLSRM